jgi:AcrR family transcriptional regulator
MTDSVSAPAGRRPGKRERLIAAARETMYAQGVEATTLADIAAAAGVPLGNVYYYFKTKNDLVLAVIEAHLAEERAILAAIDAAHATPVERLKALFGALSERSDLIARYGCPQGSLCLELGKRAEGPGPAADLLRESVSWAEAQFRAMGRPDARDLAVQVMARYQGTALLTSAFRDPDLMKAESGRVAEWIDTLG